MEWRPASIENVKTIVHEDLNECDREQRAAFVTYGVDPSFAPILRYGKPEFVVVVARKADEVIYWDDVEEGFNISPLSHDGRVVEHWCNQDSLAVALNAWVEGRTPPPRFGPATPLDKGEAG
jgi:hypothetical protein